MDQNEKMYENDAWTKGLFNTHGVWKSQKSLNLKIASEASYVYFLSGQKLVPKKCQKL